MTRTLILGGAHSGKSAYAEKLAADSGKEVICIFTARASDNPMMARIARRRQLRPAHWHSVEEFYAPGELLAYWSNPQRIVLIDCLTLWLSNLLADYVQPYPDVGPVTPPPGYEAAREQLLQALQTARGDVLLVAAESGMGVLPPDALTRWHAEQAGRLNAAVAAVCDKAVLMVAGLPLVLKGASC